MRIVILEFPYQIDSYDRSSTYNYGNACRSHSHKINTILHELKDSVSLNTVEKEEYIVLNIHDEDLFINRFFHYLLRLVHAGMINKGNELRGITSNPYIGCDIQYNTEYKNYVYSNYELNHDIISFGRLLEFVSPVKYEEFLSIQENMKNTRIKILKRRAIAEELEK